jgi:hypothetical protein
VRVIWFITRIGDCPGPSDLSPQRAAIPTVRLGSTVVSKSLAGGCREWNAEPMESFLDQEGAKHLLEQVFELWIDPEIERRGLARERASITQALIVMAPGQPITVHLDDEALLEAHVTVDAPIAKGERIEIDDVNKVSDLRPHNIDPDAAWVCFATIGGRHVIRFDFRRNKRRTAQRTERAAEFLHAARLAADAGLTGPAIENLFAAAELVVVGQMLLLGDAPPKGHVERRRWFTDWTGLGNAPVDHSKALTRLGKQRHAARYADKQLRMSAEETAELFIVVDEMVATAERRDNPGAGRPALSG